MIWRRFERQVRRPQRVRRVLSPKRPFEQQAAGTSLPQADDEIMSRHDQQDEHAAAAGDTDLPREAMELARLRLADLPGVKQVVVRDRGDGSGHLTAEAEGKYVGSRPSEAADRATAHGRWPAGWYVMRHYHPKPSVMAWLVLRMGRWAKGQAAESESGQDAGGESGGRGRRGGGRS